MCIDFQSQHLFFRTALSTFFCVLFLIKILFVIVLMVFGICVMYDVCIVYDGLKYFIMCCVNRFLLENPQNVYRDRAIGCIWIYNFIT